MMYSVMVLFRIILTFDIMDKGFNILRAGNVSAGRADIKTWAGKI